MPERSRFRILVGQLVDAANDNPQCLNTKALLARAVSTQVRWAAPHYGPPDSQVARSAHVNLVRLSRGRLWTWHKLLFYQLAADAIFYPGVYWFDDWGLRIRRAMGRRVPVIAMMEGLGGNEDRERRLSAWAGHEVFCQRVPGRLQERIDRLLSEADHVIAISPFIAAMGSRLYGDKFSVLPLGVDRTTFFPADGRGTAPFRVVGAGRLYDNKRPHLFIEMARKFPAVSFVWYGDGELLASLRGKAAKEGIQNVEFPGAAVNRTLGDEFRKANLFVLPSLSEGVPKVTQEAAACGLPVIIFGYYEAPTVRNGENGYVVWSDEELLSRMATLIADPALARRLGQAGARLAAEWSWDRVVPAWESRILQIATRPR